MKEKFAGAGAFVSAALASICCLGPLVLAGLGLGGLGLAAGLSRYRPIFIGLASLLLGMAFYFAYRRREVPCANGRCELRSGSRTLKAVLWIIAAGVVALVTLPHYLGAPRSGQADALEAGGERITLAITGMTCPACAGGIERTLKDTPGVRSVTVSFEKGEAAVVYEPGKVPTQQLIDAVQSAGSYKALPSPAE